MDIMYILITLQHSASGSNVMIIILFFVIDISFSYKSVPPAAVIGHISPPVIHSRTYIYFDGIMTILISACGE